MAASRRSSTRKAFAPSNENGTDPKVPRRSVSAEDLDQAAALAASEVGTSEIVLSTWEAIA